MKTLYLVRHAKSSWDHPELKDIERPLIDSGITKTKKIIGHFNKKQVTAGLIISSPAVRALETARLIADGIAYPVEKIRIEQAIYEAAVDDYIDVITTCPDEVSSLMIFGHNPTITYVANFFLSKKIELVPTSGVVSVIFDTDQWSGITEIKPSKESVIFPKMLK